MIHRRSIIPANKISKKRKKSTIPWRKAVDKFRRCQPKGPPLPPSCNHIYTKFECSLLDQRDMESFHRKFYYTRKKAQQDAFILRHCHGRSPKRKSSVARKERKLTVEYFVPVKERNVQVCKEAFVGILRVNKSRVNSLLKSFYKVDVSKNSTRDEQSSSRMQGRCGDGIRRWGEASNEIVINSKSLTNIEASNHKEFSIVQRCQSELEALNETTEYSISLLENSVLEEKLTKDGVTKNESNKDDVDWLKLNSKARRFSTFNWSPLKQTNYLASAAAFEGKVFDFPQKKNVSKLPFSILYQSSSNEVNPNIRKDASEESAEETIPQKILDSSQNKNASALAHPILCQSNDINRNNNVCEDAVESVLQNIPSQRIPLQEHVYESKKRRLRKLDIFDGKENIHQNSIQKKNDKQTAEQKKKSIVSIKKIEKISFQKSNANKIVLKSYSRFPLRTIR